MADLLFTLLVGTAGGLAGYKLRLPAGAMLGSMLAVGIYSCLGFQAFMSSELRIAAQIFVGCLLGLNLNRNTFMQFKTVVKPALIIIVSLLICGMVTGFILFKFCGLDFYTAFLCCTAGGMTELSLLAVTLGGDGPKVAVLHLIRMLAIVSTMPVIVQVLAKLLLKGSKKEAQ